MQWCRDAKMQGIRDIETPRLRKAKTKNFRDAEMQRPKYVETERRRDRERRSRRDGKTQRPTGRKLHRGIHADT